MIFYLCYKKITKKEISDIILARKILHFNNKPKEVFLKCIRQLVIELSFQKQLQ